MPKIELKPIADPGALTSLYADPYISRVGHDHFPASPISHPAARYLGAYVDGNLAGAFLLIESGFIELDLHALLSRKSLPHSRALGRLCLEFAFSAQHIQRVTGYVVEGLQTAVNYCLKLGFKNEGMRRDACQKGGKLVGVHTMGMTRKDWQGEH